MHITSNLLFSLCQMETDTPTDPRHRLTAHHLPFTPVYLPFFNPPTTIHVPNHLFVPEDRDASVLNILKYIIHAPKPQLERTIEQLVDVNAMNAHRLSRIRVNAFAMTKEGEEIDEDAFCRLVASATASARDSKEPWKMATTEICAVVSETPFFSARPQHHLVVHPSEINYKFNLDDNHAKRRTQWRLAWLRAVLSAMPSCFDQIESVWAIVQEYLFDEFSDYPRITAIVYDGSDGSSPYKPKSGFEVSPVSCATLKDFLVESVARSGVGHYAKECCSHPPSCVPLTVGQDYYYGGQQNDCFRRDNWVTGLHRYRIDVGSRGPYCTVYVERSVIAEELRKAKARKPVQPPPVWCQYDEKARETLRGYTAELQRLLPSEFLKKEEDAYAARLHLAGVREEHQR